MIYYFCHMEKPDWINDDKMRTWNNAFTIGFNSLLFSMFPVIFFIGFIERQSFASLITAIILWYLIYELAVFSFIRIYYQNGELEFRKPLRSYSLLFRKKNHRKRIRPDEWTEVHCYSYKGSTSYYFRNGRTAAYFVSVDGLSFFYSDLDVLFSRRFKRTDDFPRETKRRMKKEFPERVF